MTIVLCVVLVWFVCGVLEYGLFLADFIDRFPELAVYRGWREEKRRQAIVFAIGGPVSLLAMLLGSLVEGERLLGLRFDHMRGYNPAHDNGWFERHRAERRAGR
jgi:hypothetical protein